MATSILTDCSSFQGSTTSSSSDMMTGTTAASSWCAIPTSTRIRLIRLFRPHTRRMLVTPSATPSYGFSVRGGKEYNTGFFVSNVDRNSEAEQKGLRIGDQILRINGFRIDDAIHKEFCQLVTSQDRLVLKVRSVGMLPSKDSDADNLSWSVVKIPSISSTPSECSFQSSTSTEHQTLRNRNERVVNIVLNVAPRTKLGLGICKGPEWKPGIFVQFTKEKSVAREAGLRPGDQILTVNSIDFSDVLFSEAVAVMKSSNKLDMTVHKGAGCDLFPGESSGYNSSASSVTGDQSPCWGDVKSKRLTSVREETTSVAPSSPPHTAAVTKQNIWNQGLYENEPRTRSKSNAERCMKSMVIESNGTMRADDTMKNLSKSHKEINKTIIKLSESGTSINNTYVATTQTQPPPPQPLHNSNMDTMRHGSLTSGYSESVSSNDNDYNVATLTKQNQCSADVKSNIPPVPPPIAIQTNNAPKTMHHTTNSHKNTIQSPPIYKDSNIKLGGLASTMQRYATLANYVAINDLPNSPPKPPCGGDSESRESAVAASSAPATQNDSCSLSNAITEELKKRRAKRQPNCQPSQSSDGLNNNAEQKSSTKSHNSHIAVDDQHSALMNEFKQAHKRMFRNGFKESSENKDRQEALKGTTMMDDPTTYRAKGTKPPGKVEIAENTKEKTQQENGNNNNTNKNNSHIPKPPPMQMSSPLTSNNSNLKTQQFAQNSQAFNAKPTSSLYCNDQTSNVTLRSSVPSNGITMGQNGDTTLYRNSNSNRNTSPPQVTSPSSQNRQTLRLGTVTIGEYHQPGARKEPEKFDFISPPSSSAAATAKRNESGGDQHDTLQSELHSTLSRSKLKKTNGSAMEHQRNCPLHQSQQQMQQHNHQHHNHQQQHHHRHEQHQQRYASQQNHDHHHHHNSSHQPQQYEYQNVNFNNSTFSVSEMTKKLQKSSLNGGGGGGNSSTFNGGSNHTSSSGTTSIGGILKNGNRNNSSSSSSNKSTEKSIKFG
ncbi:uncharacterized protein [Musca autumnalis]|uniref:uncharacterized protein n=1 Tax=Musca autumnalis TaxID=221902 RepID=UPI003CED5E30